MLRSSVSARVSAGVAAGAMAIGAAAWAANPAFDNASQPTYAPTFNTGDNGGVGFGTWQFETSDFGGAAGLFLAVGNPDLNGVGTGSGPDAWGLFANEGFTGGDETQIAAAQRELLGGGLEVGQSFKVSFEHGGIQSGPLVAPMDRTGGFVGFVMREGAPGPTIDPFNPFGAVNGQFAFGFRGGDTEYSVYDVITPSGRGTGLPFTDGGVRVELERLGPDSYELRAEHVADPSVNVTVSVQIPDTIDLDQFGLYNRNAELADAFFNSLEVTSNCAGDVAPAMRDGLVDGEDLLAVINGFGNAVLPWSVGDSNGDGLIDGGDLLAVVNGFGSTCP